MRNREQIYGQEAAGLLRNITVYHCIRRDQLLRLYPGKEGVIENLLRYLALFFLVAMVMYMVVAIVGASETIMQGTEESAAVHHRGGVSQP